MNRLDALLRALEWRENLPDGDPCKHMSDAAMMDALNERFNQGRARLKAPIGYSDPTGDIAAAKADRGRRGRLRSRSRG